MHYLLIIWPFWSLRLAAPLIVSNIKWPLFSWLFLQQSANHQLPHIQGELSALSSLMMTRLTPSCSLTALTTITTMYNNNTEQCNCGVAK